MTGLPLIVGLGSPHGDDQAGWRVIERLHAHGVPGNQARMARTPADVWDWCDRDRPLTLCDACVNAGAPGTLNKWRWPADRLPVARGGTHDLSLGEVLSLGRELGTIPADVVVWTITGGCFEPGGEPAGMIRAAADALADQLVGELRHA